MYAAAGGMGNALIDVAKAADLTVIGVVSSDEKARFARDLGADHVINRKTGKITERVREITQNRGVDTIIDPVAGPSIPDNIALLAPCGMLVLYGGLGGRVQLDLQQTLRLSKNSPAVRQFTIHTWDHLVEERRSGMRPSSKCLQPASCIRGSMLVCRLRRQDERMRCSRAARC